MLPTDAIVRIIGRTETIENTIWLVLSGTGVEFCVTGTNASITMKSDSSYNGEEVNRARVAVYIDSKKVRDVIIEKEETIIPVFESEIEETHVVRVIKLSEAPMSTCGISEINVTGRVWPTQQKEKFIEVIGDSITCAYGVDDENRDHHFSTGTEDVTKGYAYKTAENLDVDYSMVSFSGYGIVSGYTESGEKFDTQLVPTYYEKLGFSNSTYMGKYLPQNIEWDFTKRQPDLIVINLGTNDSSYVLGIEDRREEYICGYVDFLKTVRRCNPKSTILCALGIMGTDLCPAVEEAVWRYQKETGDTNIFSMRFDEQLESDGYVADWHPTETTHNKASLRLTTEIKKVMHW